MYWFPHSHGEPPCYPSLQGLWVTLPTLDSQAWLQEVSCRVYSPWPTPRVEHILKSPHILLHPRCGPGPSSPRSTVALHQAYCYLLTKPGNPVQHIYKTDISMNRNCFYSLFYRELRSGGLGKKWRTPNSKVPTPGILHRGCPGRGWHFRTHRTVEGMKWAFKATDL